MQKYKKTLKNDCLRFPKVSWKFRISTIFSFAVVSRGVARNFIEGGSKSSKASASTVGQWIKFWTAERLKWQISNPFQLDFTYSNLSFLATELFSLPKLLI